MANVINSIRITASRWESEEAFTDLLSVLERHKDCIDQVAFFTTYFHPPMPLDTARRHCAILKDRVARVRTLGMSAGLNILATVGHHPERLDESLQGDWPYMTNIDGQVCLGSRCMNNAAFLEEYVRPLYEIHCDVKPDFIWIDDDVRYGHLPVGFCCFCDGCIERFNRDFGRHFDRAALKAALDDPTNLVLRREWLIHQSDKIVDLLAFIRRVVNKCDDTIMLGLMTGERYFEGYDFARWAEALSDGGKYPIMWRPGGGNYDDKSFEEFLWKSGEIGRQAANLPSYVTEVQSEIENHPHRVLRKGSRYTALEALMYLTAGCTGTALNILPGTDGGEPAAIIDRHLEAIRAVTPFMKKLSAVCGREPAVGIHTGWHIHSQATLAGSFTSGGGDVVNKPWQELFSLGLPEGFAFDKASVHLLSGRAPYAFSDEELTTILSRGVYLDAGAVTALNDLGYGELIGFSVDKTFEEDTVEVYADHPLNRGFIGKNRYCSSIFSKGGVTTLTAVPGAETLCYLSDFQGRELASCTMGLFRNRLGGIVCAAGYYPAGELSDTAKSTQMKRLMRTLSGDTLPAVVESYERVRAIVRGDGITLLNTSPDHLTDVAVLVSGNVSRAVLCDENCRETVLQSVGKDGKMTRFVLPQLPPLSVALLMVEKGDVRCENDV